MQYLVVLFTILVFTACGAAPATNTTSPVQTHAPERQKALIEPAVQFLLTSAAADFHKFGPSGPLQFRNASVGHLMTTDGKEQYILCGQFLRTQEGDKSEWTNFATIKTSDYEQYIGGGSDFYCKRSSFVLDTNVDLSSALQTKLDSLR